MSFKLAALLFLLAVMGASPALLGREAEVSSLKTEALTEFSALGAKEQALLRYALGLTERKLRYQYGSNAPSEGGMDCSGTVSHILNHLGYPAPRMAHLIYLWAQQSGTLVRVKDCHRLDDRQLSRLRPGDLLFWEGTYDIGERSPPISHVMIYLGHEKTNGRAVMVGASSGRYYAGRARHGVSVFDFVLPGSKAKSKFVGYARIPGLERAAAPSSAPAATPPAISNHGKADDPAPLAPQKGKASGKPAPAPAPPRQPAPVTLRSTLRSLLQH